MSVSVCRSISITDLFSHSFPHIQTSLLGHTVTTAAFSGFTRSSGRCAFFDCVFNLSTMFLCVSSIKSTETMFKEIASRHYNQWIGSLELGDAQSTQIQVYSFRCVA